MTSKFILFIDIVELFQILVIVMDFYSLIISLILKHLFASTTDPFILYFEQGNTSKNKLKNLKIVISKNCLPRRNFELALITSKIKSVLDVFIVDRYKYYAYYL